MKELNLQEWIVYTEEKEVWQRIPNKVYSLKVRFKDMIDHLEKQKKKAMDNAGVSIEQLKEQGKNKLTSQYHADASKVN
jgi:predicted transcriptional regulator